MTKDELFNLLDEMSLPDSVIDRLDVPKWRFWSRENEIREKEAHFLIREYIGLRGKKTDTKRRENVYALLAKLLRENMDPVSCQFLIDCLKRETNKNALHTILDGISHLHLPSGTDISAIIACSKSSEWLVRHGAIVALGASNTDASREAVRYWVQQEDEKQNKYELIYAQASLGNIGTEADIPLLERHSNSRIRDVKDSAAYAIENIRHRLGL